MAINRVPEPQAESKRGGWFKALLAVAAIAILIGKGSSLYKTDGTAPTQYAKVDKSAAMQATRTKLISDLMNNGVFRKVEFNGTAARVTIGPSFNRVDFDTKQSFISVVYAQYFDGTGIADFVRVIDNMTGKEIGMYSAAQGGLKMY